MRSIEATMTVLLVLFGDGKRRGTTTEHRGKHDSRWIRQALHFFWLRACKDDSYQVLHHGQAKKKLSNCQCALVIVWFVSIMHRFSTRGRCDGRKLAPVLRGCFLGSLLLWFPMWLHREYCPRGAWARLASRIQSVMPAFRWLLS